MWPTPITARVVEFSSAGGYLSEIDGLGNSFESAYPVGVAVDHSGNIFISEEDGNNGLIDHVVVYNAGHAYVTTIGSYGTQNGQFTYPYGLAVDPSGNLYVADPNTGRVEEFLATPEPSTLALLAASALGLVACAWRKRRLLVATPAKRGSFAAWMIVFASWVLLGPGRALAATPMAPAELPGNGLAQHPFFYAGEDKVQSMFLVKDGKIAWSHTMPNSKGEISDAFLLANGNVLFAHQFGITELSPQKTIVWRFDAPRGCEIHTAQPLAGQRVMYVQNGDPARLKIVSQATGKSDLEFTLPVKQPKGAHGQFRHARMTARGTFLVAHMDMGKVAEYDGKGQEVWSVDVPSPWSASRLPNGNTLITSNQEFGARSRSRGKTVWELTRPTCPIIRWWGRNWRCGWSTATRWSTTGGTTGRTRSIPRTRRFRPWK